MYFIAIIILIGSYSIKRSLNAIEKNTNNMERYAFEVYHKTKKMETIVNNFKKCLSYSDIDQVISKPIPTTES
jgi:hypothetical protein